MKKLILIFLLIGLTAAFALADQFFIENGTGSYSFIFVYVSDSRSDEWGTSLLGVNVLRPGQRMQVTTTIPVGNTTWNIMVVDEDNDTYTFWRRTVRSNEVVRVTLDDLD